MRSPEIEELPPPIDPRRGWPWDSGSPRLPDRTPGGGPWPRISIVTPSYNQGRFLEEAIRSVLLQGYPDLEYIVIDGRSSDNSVSIIEAYAPWIAHWVSEKDNGQSAAINKGWARCTGEILAWINSDDAYLPGAFGKIAAWFDRNPGLDIVYGDCRMTDEAGRFIQNAPTREFALEPLVCNTWFIPQQSTFIRRRVVERIGNLREDLHLAMDWEYWLRAALHDCPIGFLPEMIASFRTYPDAKTYSQSEASGREQLSILSQAFRGPGRIEKILPFKRKAFAQITKWAGEAHYWKKSYWQALALFVRAVWYQPRLLADRGFQEKLKVIAVALSGR